MTSVSFIIAVRRRYRCVG